MTLGHNETPRASPRSAAWHGLAVTEVAGGAGTNPVWLSNVSDADLKTALEGSLREGGYLTESGPAPYQVSAHIMSLDKPAGSLDPLLWLAPVDWSVTIKVRYVVSAPGHAPEFDTIVAATGTAEGTSSVSSQGRVRVATEVAVRNDIQAFLTRLNAEWKAAGDQTP